MTDSFPCIKQWAASKFSFATNLPKSIQDGDDGGGCSEWGKWQREEQEKILSKWILKLLTSEIQKQSEHFLSRMLRWYFFGGSDGRAYVILSLSWLGNNAYCCFTVISSNNVAACTHSSHLTTAKNWRRFLYLFRLKIFWKIYKFDKRSNPIGEYRIRKICKQSKMIMIWMRCEIFPSCNQIMR